MCGILIAMDLKDLNNPGISVPMAHDSPAGVPSVTLLLMYVANILAILSLVYLHIRASALIATSLTIIYAVICTILYLMRKLSKAKFDLKNQEFEVDSGDEPSAPSKDKDKYDKKNT